MHNIRLYRPPGGTFFETPVPTFFGLAPAIIGLVMTIIALFDFTLGFFIISLLVFVIGTLNTSLWATHAVNHLPGSAHSLLLTYDCLDKETQAELQITPKMLAGMSNRNLIALRERVDRIYAAQKRRKEAEDKLNDRGTELISTADYIYQREVERTNQAKELARNLDNHPGLR